MRRFIKHCNWIGCRIKGIDTRLRSPFSDHSDGSPSARLPPIPAREYAAERIGKTSQGGGLLFEVLSTLSNSRPAPKSGRIRPSRLFQGSCRKTRHCHCTAGVHAEAPWRGDILRGNRSLLACRSAASEVHCRDLGAYIAHDATASVRRDFAACGYLRTPPRPSPCSKKAKLPRPSALAAIKRVIGLCAAIRRGRSPSLGATAMPMLVPISMAFAGNIVRCPHCLDDAPRESGRFRVLP